MRLWLFPLILIACSGQLDSGSSAISSGAGSDRDGDAGAGGAQGPYRITCSVYHRDLGVGATEHARESFVFMTDEPSQREIVLSNDAIPVSAKLAPAPDAPDLVDLSISFPRSNMEQHFRVAREEMPPYDLIGSHGFSGLNYVATPGSSVDVQFICEASPRNEERPRPPPGPGDYPPSPPEPPTPPPATPFRIRCETSVNEGAGDQNESFVLEGATERTLVLGGRTVELRLFDDLYEGRSFVVRFPERLQQLYQLDRTVPLRDATRGPGGLTGRTVLRSDDGDGGVAAAVSLACGAAP
jgi:hypothetical protein